MCQYETLKAVRSIGFSVNHVHDCIVASAALMISACPIVTRSTSVRRDVKILWIVETFVRGVLDAINHPWLQIKQQSSRNKVLIIGLQEDYTAQMVEWPWRCHRFKTRAYSSDIAPGRRRRLSCQFPSWRTPLGCRQHQCHAPDTAASKTLAQLRGSNQILILSKW